MFQSQNRHGGSTIIYKPTTGLKETLDQVPFMEPISFMNLDNYHYGQRKLALNEVKFYSMLPKHSVIVYSGSASGEHTPFILDAFPTFKFILIDPNYHSINYPYEYIYIDRSKVDRGNLIFIKKSSEFESSRGKKLKSMYDPLTKMKFADGKIRDVTSCDSAGSLDDLKSLDNRVYVIQDYMSETLAKKLAAKLKSFKATYFYTSDIRSEATDFGYLNDFAIQALVVKALGAKLNHLKFRMPRFEKMKRIPDFSNLERCKQVFPKLDFLELHRNKKFVFFDGTVHLQPWGPPSTSETRLITDGKTLVEWNANEYNGKMTYINLSRQLIAHDVEPIFNYDKCHDCALEMKILQDYFDDWKSASKKLDKAVYWPIGSRHKSDHKLMKNRLLLNLTYEEDWEKKKAVIKVV
jgi:predicted nucleic acid-binding Zn ribbon protein